MGGYLGHYWLNCAAGTDRFAYSLASCLGYQCFKCRGRSSIKPRRKCQTPADSFLGGMLSNRVHYYCIYRDHRLYRFGSSSYLSYSHSCLLYTSDAADEEDSVDLGGRRIIKKKT